MPKWVTTANRTDVIQNDVTHLCILCVECFSLLNTHLNAQCVLVNYPETKTGRTIQHLDRFILRGGSVAVATSVDMSACSTA